MKKLTASDMGKRSHQKMKERLGEEGYREMQKNKSMKAKVARDIKRGITCFDCIMPATRVIEFLGVGLCEKHTKELLTSSLLAKAVNSQVEKPLSPSKRKNKNNKI